MSPFSFTLKFSSSPPHFEQTQQVPKTGSWPQRPGSLHLMSFSCAFQECAATDQQSQHFREIPGADNSMQRILMAAGQSCCALAILLAIVNFQHGGEARSRGRDSHGEPWTQGKDVPHACFHLSVKIPDSSRHVKEPLSSLDYSNGII